MSVELGAGMRERQPDSDEPMVKPAFAIVLAGIAGLLRLVPHPWNFTPQGAVEVFAGARISGWNAFAIPIGLRMLTDGVLLFSQGVLSQPALYATFLPWVYGSMIVSIGMGRLLRNMHSPFAIASVTLLSASQFFLVTNFGAWIGSEMYPHTFEGLLQSYAMGIPFFGPALLGSCFYSAVLFGAAYYFAQTTSVRSVTPQTNLGGRPE